MHIQMVLLSILRLSSTFHLIGSYEALSTHILERYLPHYIYYC